MAFSRSFMSKHSFVHNPRTKTTYKSIVYLKASIKKNVRTLNKDQVKSISRERNPKDPAPSPGSSDSPPNAQTTTKGKVNSLLRKSDSQLYSTAATSPVSPFVLSQLPLLYQPTSPTHTPFFHSADPLQHTSHTQQKQQCRQAKCKRFWRCPASLSRTALSSSTAARMSSAPSCSLLLHLLFLRPVPAAVPLLHA